MRDLTIPPTEQERWVKLLFIPMPFLSILFILIATDSYKLVLDNTYVIIGLIISAAILSTVIAIFTSRIDIPNITIVKLNFNK